MNNGERFDKVDEKLDKMDERLGSVEKILAVNTAILEEHQRRSTTLEDRFIAELKPLKAQHALIAYGFKTVVWIAVAVGGIVGFIHMLHELGAF